MTTREGRSGKCPRCGRRFRCLADEWIECPYCESDEVPEKIEEDEEEED